MKIYPPHFALGPSITPLESNDFTCTARIRMWIVCRSKLDPRDDLTLQWDHPDACIWFDLKFRRQSSVANTRRAFVDSQESRNTVNPVRRLAYSDSSLGADYQHTTKCSQSSCPVAVLPSRARSNLGTS